jgi:hypothetical protein
MAGWKQKLSRGREKEKDHAKEIEKRQCIGIGIEVLNILRTVDGRKTHSAACYPQNTGHVTIPRK